MVGVLVRGGMVVSADGVHREDIRIRDGRIAETRSTLRPEGDRVVDADGLTVLPGAIDPHGHQWEPGFTSPPDFSDATASAAVGGVTTLLDHPLTTPIVSDIATYRAKAALGERTSLIDFGLHVAATPPTLDELPGLWAAGATGVKVFTCPTGTSLDGFDDANALEDLFVRLGRIRALALVHAEDQTILDRNAAGLTAAGRTGVADFPDWHDAESEIVAVERVLALAARHRVSTYVVHASQPAVVDAVKRSALHGLPTYSETCPHYLHLTDTDLARLGAWAMSAPPVRDATTRAALRKRLARGRIDTIGSDHCAISATGKDVATMDRIVPGVPGLDLFMPLLLDLVVAGDLTLPRLGEVTAQIPAWIFGIDDRKGAIIDGLDADLVFADLSATRVVHAKDLPGSAGWSPYEGMTLRGTVFSTWVRGEEVARDGRPVGRPGFGRHQLRREQWPEVRKDG